MKTPETNEMENDDENIQAGSDCQERLVRQYFSIKWDCGLWLRIGQNPWMIYIYPCGWTKWGLRLSLRNRVIHWHGGHHIDIFLGRPKPNVKAQPQAEHNNDNKA